MIAPPTAAPDSMCLVLPVPFREQDGRFYVEAQAANGLDRWADNFASLRVLAPVVPEALASSLAGFVWRDMETLEHRDSIQFQPLPWAYSPRQFFRQRKSVRSRLAEAIRTTEHLQFAIGGMVGDWAAIAALEAIDQQRHYAIHTDRVEHEVIRETAKSGSAVRRLRVGLEAPLMERYHRHVIERCSLGLWHGDDCFRAYAPWCRESHLVHDIHTKESDLIGAEALQRKLADLRSAEVLEILYAGRLDPMKAPLEWLRALAAARQAGARFRATWFGEGPMLEESIAEAARLNLSDVVRYGGFVSVRGELLQRVQEAHAFVFTHVTPESPRNLLEALVSGTALLGYQNAYAEDLIAERGGGVLAPIHDVRALGQVIAKVACDRERLVKLTEQAALNGRRFTDAAVFAERSALIKQFA